MGISGNEIDMVSTMPTNTAAMTDIEKGIIRTLLYFDIFDYPLTAEEIIKFHPSRIDAGDITRELSLLTQRKLIFKTDTFYSVRPDSALATRRLSGNKLANEIMPTARKYSNLIFNFPFVRAVMLSGSLSKNFMDKGSDIDYFIVTERGRLWLVRGLLALFRRVFLLNSHKFFCTNYFVDVMSLEIEEKNIYTAFETATLIPVCGGELWKQFHSKNNWLKVHLPNHVAPPPVVIAERGQTFKKILEKAFSGRLGEKLDVFIMDRALQRWRKNFSAAFTPAEFDIAFKSRRNVSKGHPRFFQKRVLEYFQRKINDYEVQHQMKLSHE
jgi:hypothetical protein